jgi:hypothetical protein
MAEPIDMIMPMLRDMRAENEARHGEVLARFDRVELRLQKLEDLAAGRHLRAGLPAPRKRCSTAGRPRGGSSATPQNSGE